MLNNKSQNQIKLWIIARNALFVCFTFMSSLLLLLMGVIAIKLAIAQRQAPEPQAILVLGGGEGREEFAAQFAHKHPHLKIWVSSADYLKTSKFFREASISQRQIICEWRAVDTVANFTYNLKHLQSNHIKHIYLITSEDHLPRAKMIASLILGSRGIAFTSVAIPSDKRIESLFLLRAITDFFHVLIWIITSYESPPNNPGEDSLLFNPTVK